MCKAQCISKSVRHFVSCGKRNLKKYSLKKKNLFIAAHLILIEQCTRKKKCCFVLICVILYCGASLGGHIFYRG